MSLLMLAMLVRSGTTWPRRVVERIDRCPRLACDFTDFYLPQTRLLAAGEEGVIEGFQYPPLLPVLLLPMAGWEEQRAVRWWTALQMLSLLVLVLLCKEQLRPLRRASATGANSIQTRAMLWLGASALCLTSLPVLSGIKWGQISLPLVVLCLLALRRSGPLRAPLLGTAIALKLYPVLYLADSTLRRRWSTIVWTSAWVVLLGLLVPGLILGWRPSTALWQSARAVDLNFAGEGGGQNLVAALLRWCIDGRHLGLPDPQGPLLPLLPAAEAGGLAILPLLLAGIGLLLALPLALSTVRRLQREELDESRRAALLLTATTLLLSPMAWHHYFAFLPFAQAVALGSGGRLAACLALLSALVAAVPALMLADFPFVYFPYSAWGGTTLAALLVWLALLAPRARGEMR